MKKLCLLTLALVVFTLSGRAEDTTAVAKTPEIDHMVYLSFLPDTDELMADAKANGLTVLRLDKLSDQVVVTYKYPDGHEATLGYKLLSSASSSDRVAGGSASLRTVSPAPKVVERTVIEREPEIIYVDRTPRTRVVYRDRWDDFWAPLTIGLGIGYISGHHSHHYYPRYSGHYRSYRSHRGHVSHRSHHSSHRGGHRGRR